MTKITFIGTDESGTALIEVDTFGEYPYEVVLRRGETFDLTTREVDTHEDDYVPEIPQMAGTLEDLDKIL